MFQPRCHTLKLKALPYIFTLFHTYHCSLALPLVSLKDWSTTTTCLMILVFFFFFLLLLLFFCFVSLLYASHLPRFRNAIITWQPTPIHLFHLRVNSFASLLSRTSFLVRYLGQVAVVLNLSENRTCILMMF